MVEQISMWQMVTDLCLVTAILILAFRFVKSSRLQALLPQLLETEARITRLIAEAESAAQHLNDTLLRREQNIHRYLADVEKSEKEISLSIVEGESLTKELALLTEGAYRETKELERMLKEIKGARTVRPSVTEEVDTDSRSERRSGIQIEKEVFTTRAESKRASEWLETDFTEEHPQPVENKTSLQKLQNIYKAAEDMLREGDSSEDVAEKTGLDIDGVARLAEMIEIERQEEREQTLAANRTAKDNRLGVLGGLRRG